MRLYFDNNIYSLITGHGEVDEVIEWTTRNNVTVPYSDTVFQEMKDDPDMQRRRVSQSALARISTLEPWLTNKMFLEAVQQMAVHRKSWIRRAIDGRPEYATTEIDRSVLHSELRRFKYDEAQRLERLWDYYGDLKGTSFAAQREFKSNIWIAKSKHFYIASADMKGPCVAYNLDNFENAWREDLFVLWQQNVLDRGRKNDFQKLSDEMLFVDRMRSFSQFAWFCMEQVDGNGMRLNKCRSAVWYAQLELKIENGNPADCQQAPYLDDVDYFLTRDKAYFTALNKAKSIFDFRATPVMVRSDASFMRQVNELALLR